MRRDLARAAAGALLMLAAAGCGIKGDPQPPGKGAGAPPPVTPEAGPPGAGDQQALVPD